MEENVQMILSYLHINVEFKSRQIKFEYLP